MDTSRDNDLARLHARFHDSTLDEVTRRRAHKTFVRIQSQVTDRRLTKLRNRMIRAKEAGDEEVADNIERQIKEYTAKAGISDR